MMMKIRMMMLMIMMIIFFLYVDARTPLTESVDRFQHKESLFSPNERATLKPVSDIMTNLFIFVFFFCKVSQ